MRIRTGLLLAALLAAAACSKGGAATDEESAPAVSPAATAKAGEIFAQRCTPCHGAEGRGDGAASAGLTPKPRNFHDPDWQKQVTDDHIIQIIKAGGAAVGLSPAMPPNPDLNDPAVLIALKDHLRGFAKAP